MAKKFQNLDIVKFLLENGADIHAKNGIDWSPLHNAIVNSGNLETVKFLVQNGAHFKDKKNQTLLDIVVSGGSYDDMVKYLKETEETKNAGDVSNVRFDHDINMINVPIKKEIKQEVKSEPRDEKVEGIHDE